MTAEEWLVELDLARLLTIDCTDDTQNTLESLCLKVIRENNHIIRTKCGVQYLLT